MGATSFLGIGLFFKFVLSPLWKIISVPGQIKIIPLPLPEEEKWYSGAWAAEFPWSC